VSEAEILVSGATGRTGGAAIDTLLKLGKSVRAYVRSDDERAAALRQRGVDIAVGDFTDIDDIRAAMEGISSAYFLHPIAPGILGAAAYFAQAAKEASVTAIVNMSQISARRESTSHAAQDHWVSERVFDWSDVATTHLRPTFFADWSISPCHPQTCAHSSVRSDDDRETELEWDSKRSLFRSFAWHFAVPARRPYKPTV
jgi:NAD(P)H dehydrogenase (quinone)